jgi:hypothetical protein
MKSVRTSISVTDRENFKIFLELINISDVLVGDYINVSDPMMYWRCLCYAYSEKSAETVAILTHIALKYGNLQNAYNNYKEEMFSSTIGQAPHAWLP